MPGIVGKATISGDVCRVSVAGLGPRRRVSRSLKAACSQVRNMGIGQDPFNLPYSSWLENTVASSVIRNTKLTHDSGLLGEGYWAKPTL